MENPADSFGTFLEVLQGKKRPHGRADDSTVRILVSLAENQPALVSELLMRTQLELDDFSRALGGLREAGLVGTSMGPDGKMANLTESGARVASVARALAPRARS